MNLIDKAILEWSYRTKKGYPDLNNKEDLRVFESLFGFDLKEASVNINSRKATELLLQKYPETFSKMSDSFRVGNKAKISSDEFIKIIQDTFNTTPEVHPPGTERNSQQSKPKGSSKYTRYIFNTDEGEISIILSGGPKAETSERQERGIIDAVNSVEGVKTVIGANGFKVENVLKADKVESAYKHEPYADVQFEIKGKSDPFMVSAKATATPSIAGGGLAGFTLFGEDVRKFIEDFYNDAYKHYKKIFDEHSELDLNTDLYRTDYFKDVNRKVPSELVLEIMEGTPQMGGPIDAYYIGNMDVTHTIEGSTVTLDGSIIPIEKFANETEIYVHIKKRSGSYFFTDSKQTVNGLTIPRIFTNRPGGTQAQARLGSNTKLRGSVII